MDEGGRHVAFVQGDLPERDAGMIAVAPDELPAFLVFLGGERGIGIVVLPAQNAVHDDDAQFIAGIQKGGGLRIMRQPDVVEARFLDFERVAILRGIGKGVADEGIFLVAVAAAEKELLVIQEKTVLGDLQMTDADPGAGGLHNPAGFHEFGVQ